MKDTLVDLKIFFSCEECGRDNFLCGIVPELSEEDIAELKYEHGIEDYAVGDFMMMPEFVTCEYCKTSFETEHYHQDLDELSDDWDYLD